MRNLKSLFTLVALGMGLYLGVTRYDTITAWLLQASDQVFGDAATKAEKVRNDRDSNPKVEKVIIR
jgi:hypothetical protein